MKYTVKVPPTKEQGGYKTTVTPSRLESKEQAALSDYNSARAHDGLPPLKRMPVGTVYAAQYEYEIQGLYNGRWETECVEETKEDGLKQLECYYENVPSGTFRMRRVPSK